MLNITVTRFNKNTFEENKNFRINNSINCIYSIPIKICDKILPNEKIIVIEMNNTKNKIEGFGIIKNKLDLQNKYKIYNDNNYNRYTYKSNYRIDIEDLTSYELFIIKELENLLFKTRSHCKRGQGIQKLPSHITFKNYKFNYIRFLNEIYLSRFNK